MYRCSSRETPSGPCGVKRVPAEGPEGVEAWAWDGIAARLHDPATIAAELERQRHAGPDPTITADLEAARRSLAKVEKQQERLIQRFRQSEDDRFPWELVEREILRGEQEKEQLCASVVRLEGRLAEQQATVERLDALNTYCERVARNLDAFGFREKRLAFEALAVQIVANGRDWRLDGAIPLDDGVGVVPLTCS